MLMEIRPIFSIALFAKVTRGWKNKREMELKIMGKELTKERVPKQC